MRHPGRHNFREQKGQDDTNACDISAGKNVAKHRICNGRKRNHATSRPANKIDGEIASDFKEQPLSRRAPYTKNKPWKKYNPNAA